MSPRDLDVAAAHTKLRLIRELLDDLESLRGATSQRLHEERFQRYATERILTQLVDLAVSINNHITAVHLQRAPSDYRESFELAAHAGAIPQKLASELGPSVGLRNVLTHEYVEVELEIVARSIDLALDGYRQYVNEVARFLSESGQ